MLDRKVVDEYVKLTERNIFFRALSSWLGYHFIMDCTPRTAANIKNITPESVINCIGAVEKKGFTNRELFVNIINVLFEKHTSKLISLSNKITVVKPSNDLPTAHFIMDCTPRTAANIKNITRASKEHSR